MLPKKHRISRNDFNRIYKEGKRSKGEFGMLVGIKGTEGIPKFGFVVNKKVGNAVDRHFVTRKLRAISMEYIKEKSLNSPILFQYVSFKKETDYSKLKKELYSQIDEVISQLG